MSIFSKLQRAKQAADSQKNKKAAATESKPAPAPYRHVPTHAATDALLGAPATWRESDKKAIKAQHKRRSEYNLSRNPSSLSNVTTLNRDQSFTSKGWAHGAPDQRKHYPIDGTSNTYAPRRSQVQPIGTSTTAQYSRATQLPPSERSSTTNFSRMSQLPPSERSSMTNSSRMSQLSPPELSPRHPNMRRSRVETTPPLPPSASHLDGRLDGPYPSEVAPSKDVKFDLPSETEVSPSHSSENSSSSSRESYYEPGVPARNPRRPFTLESPVRKFDDPTHFQYQQSKSLNQRVGEFPRLSTLPPTSDPFPSASPTTRTENDLSFIDFGPTSIAAH